MLTMEVVFDLIIMVNYKQMRRWKTWEEETRTLEYQIANGRSICIHIPILVNY